MNQPDAEVAQIRERESISPALCAVWIATVLAVSWLVPQSVALQWFPLNHSDRDNHYLELVLQAHGIGHLKVSYDLTRGLRDEDAFVIPLAATADAYTHLIPLPDAPLVALQFQASAPGGLDFRQIRIVNRNGIEISRLRYDRFRVSDADSLPSRDGGWQWLPGSGKTLTARCDLPAAIVPSGMNMRNFQRCVRSVGYLGLILGILLFGARAASFRSSARPPLLASIAWPVLLASGLALVGNRGLLRNSVHSAQYPATSGKNLYLEVDLVTAGPTVAQLSWDRGSGFTASDSTHAALAATAFPQIHRFLLPAGPIQALRFAPLDGPGSVHILDLRVVDENDVTRLLLPRECLLPAQDLRPSAAAIRDRSFKTTADARDPILYFRRQETLAIAALTARRQH